MNEDTIQLSAVEDHDGILTIRGGGSRRDWNGIHYKQGMSSKNVGTTKLSANVATIPPGGVAYAHIHVGFELILYILEGKVRHEFGPGLKQAIENEAGDFIYIKPGVPDEVFNLSKTRAGRGLRCPLFRRRVGQHHSIRSEPGITRGRKSPPAWPMLNWSHGHARAPWLPDCRAGAGRLAWRVSALSRAALSAANIEAVLRSFIERTDLDLSKPRRLR